ncbi:MAG: rane protein [Mycobacterium sp.]|nr:rane protein [Mycobacterium sp.]
MPDPDNQDRTDQPERKDPELGEPVSTRPDVESDGPPRAVFIAALLIAVAAVVGVLTIAATRTPAPTPVPIAAAPAPQADGTDCIRLMDALPDQLGDYRRAIAAEPVPPGAAAWQAEPGGEPVILRCGLDRPIDFVVGTPVQVVDGVQWFRVSDPSGMLTSWFAVDRAVYVALTLPEGSGPTPIQEITRVIEKTLPPVAPRPGPPG